MEHLSFETNPDSYKHWRLEVEGEVARLLMNVDENAPLVPGYQLKLNSYDLGVDIELADAVNRLRFEHPEVRCVVVSSAHERVFCAGANIPMLASSTHAWKVNFCKFTNETRISIEDASAHSGQRYLAALNGTTAGGGYELAMACDEIILVDDGNSAVSLPEVPLLAVLPGTGGLTRLVDKRKVRRDLADVFCTVAEGVKGKRAKQWGLVDHVASKSQFAKITEQRSQALCAQGTSKGPGVSLPKISPEVGENTFQYQYVTLKVEPAKRVAELCVLGSSDAPPTSGEGFQQAGANTWALKAFRELDDALLTLRFRYPEVGLVLIKTSGVREQVQAWDQALFAHRSHWFVNEILGFQRRVLRRLENTSKSFFAIADTESCFTGTLLELGMAADRLYMLNDPDNPVYLTITEANAGFHTMTNGLSRLQSRHWSQPENIQKLLENREPMATDDAMDAGLVTLAPDDLDWEDELRVAIEERVSLSPDALTGMEASLRYAGPETMDTKVFGRLSAWQNWIFQRPNAVGSSGALSLYGAPTRPTFDYRRC
jgi:benzoyl-CoA-dihydrodiol lyase